MPATLKLTRQGTVGFELRRGQFEVSLDGTNSGVINYGDKIELPVEPGHHTLQIRKGRYSSQSRPFDVADDEVVYFRCHGAMVWPRWLVSFAVPGLGISLKQE